MHRVAPNGTPGQLLANKGRSPVPRFALVGNNRKVRYLGHMASDKGPRALCHAMSTPAGAIAGPAMIGWAGGGPTSGGRSGPRAGGSGRQTATATSISGNV